MLVYTLSTGKNALFALILIAECGDVLSQVKMKLLGMGVSHDVTKIQPRKQLILQRFYFHDVYEQLKTSIHTNFRSE